MPTGGPLAVLWGDNSPAHLASGQRPVFEEHGFAFAQMNASGCAPIIGLSPPDRPNCKNFNENVFGWIEDNRPAVVIMSMNWIHQWGNVEQLVSQIRSLREIGTEVILLGQTPIYRSTVPSLLAERWLRGDRSNVSGKELAPSVFKVDGLFSKRLSDVPGVRYISVLNALCAKQSCPMFGDGAPYHWDKGHLTDVGAKAFVAAILPQLQSVLSNPAGLGAKTQLAPDKQRRHTESFGVLGRCNEISGLRKS